MLANLKTQLVSAQQWLSTQTGISQDNGRTGDWAEAHQDALAALLPSERGCLSTAYLESADYFERNLRNARETLRRFIPYRPHGDADPCDAEIEDWYLLAQINTYLGEYSKAEECYTTAISQSEFLPSRHFTRRRILRNYVHFLAESGRSLAPAENLIREILATSIKEASTVNEIHTPFAESSEAMVKDADSVFSILVKDVEILSLAFCLQGRFQDALSCINRARELYRAKHHSISADISLYWAVTSTGLRDKEKAETEFRRAMIISAVNLGNWHFTTLGVLHTYASALLDWSRESEAAALFTECYIGRHYRLGPHHPSTKNTFSKLGKCTLSQSQGDIVRMFRGSPTYDTLRSIAYEHMELWTSADILDCMGDSPFSFVENLIRYLLEDPSIRLARTTQLEDVAKKIFRLERTMAACKSRLGLHDHAALRLEWLSQGHLRMNQAMTLQSKLDCAIYLSHESKNRARVQELSQFVFYESDILLKSYQDGRSSLTSAFRKRLTQYNLTHFEWGHLPNLDASPFTVVEKVGNGSSACVDSVSMNGVQFAQKLVILKGPYASHWRKQTRQEVDILKRLYHPHIVQIYCTFEERHYFAMVMQPLASGDLEAFLTQDTLPLELSPTIEKWLGCLTATLSYIHNHGIKHRDIKPKNTLVKNGQIFFSDFGSSRDCSLETGMSTDGPVYGHTRIYSAPEVIAEERRNESADIFSLGCVFTEMISVLCGRTLGSYDKFRGCLEYRRAPYHETLHHVESWFTNEEQMPTWGTNMYIALVKPMLAVNPEHRPSAHKTVMAIRNHFQSQKLAAETFCQVCYQYSLAEV
ncbi:kinase-like protein [Zopfia rhizophila CBS 207.26]|uniref:Kinase-like protein n=1 Tax=Zopfia rhizophila CBS 207.26 TaxID=1314779 RepID=A0A6A6DII8_9PEZI|nr:kinase-like protein [Zopfia rhizophila CBS 207.26]